MKKLESKAFTGTRAWQAIEIMNINNVTCRLHWTDKPYVWHVNDGEEVFAVMDGEVNMHVRQNGIEKIINLQAGDIFHATLGDEHYGEPIGEARILVIEKEGSI